MRIQSGPLKATLESTARVLDAAGEFGTPPESLGASSYTELLASGKVQFKVDPKYPQALGIEGIVFRLNAFQILLNSPIVDEVGDSAARTAVTVREGESMFKSRPRKYGAFCIIFNNLNASSRSTLDTTESSEFSC
jgi:hypothetical protein